MNNTLKQQNTNIKWIINLRAFACISVIMIHVIAGWAHTPNVALNAEGGGY